MENNAQMAKRDTVILKSQVGGTFGSKLTFTIGTAYISFGMIGFLMGLVKTKKPNFAFPTKRLMVSYYFNAMMQRGLQYAHNASSTGLIYTLIGYVITKGFDEELHSVSNIAKNTVVGGITGGLIKVPLGWKAGFVGLTLGSSAIFLANLVTDELRERDIIGFEMRFDA